MPFVSPSLCFRSVAPIAAERRGSHVRRSVAAAYTLQPGRGELGRAAGNVSETWQQGLCGAFANQDSAHNTLMSLDQLRKSHAGNGCEVGFSTSKPGHLTRERRRIDTKGVISRAGLSPKGAETGVAAWRVAVGQAA
jgi:hypothetical protein